MKKTGTWYFYGSYKMKNGKYRQYKKRGFPKKKDAVKTTHDIEVAMELMINNVGYETAKNYPMRRKTPCFSYGECQLESIRC